MKPFGLALLMVPAVVLAAPGTWVIDEAHTQTSFEVVHLVIASYRGEFARTHGVLTLDEDHPQASHVEASIDAASIRTRDPAWDDRLRSSEFLDAARYPTISFVSIAVVRAAVETHGRDDQLGQFRVTGLLTLHGTTRRVILEVSVTPAVMDAEGRLRRGIQARTILNRQDFGIRWSRAIEAGPLLSDEVRIQIDAELVQANPRAGAVPPEALPPFARSGAGVRP
jgi:polyisoprenoid-binding protein YceI